MKIGIIVGTRPELIKMFSIIKACQQKNVDFFLLHTNQHYSHNMDKIFFDELNLPAPHYNLNVGSGKHGEQTGKMLHRIEEVLLQEKPDIVLVQGDTNTVLAGALGASKLHIKVGHVEAGLRSFDRKMPEEINRIMADHVADYLFCPTSAAKENCIKEGIDSSKIFVTGNTIVDAVAHFSSRVDENISVLGDSGVEKGNFILVTAHRPANVDDTTHLHKFLDVMKMAHHLSGKILLYPIHPRTKANLARHSIELPAYIKAIEPVSYFDFQTLLKNAFMTITDSGGVQEEACIHNIPCLTIRENTERPETLHVGANKLIGLDTVRLQAGLHHFSQQNTWENPFGNGMSGEAIIDIIQRVRE